MTVVGHSPLRGLSGGDWSAAKEIPSVSLLGLSGFGLA